MRVIHGQPNIYALFMAIAAHLLAKNGELIFITPRSYTAGPYFRLFREHFFSYVEPILSIYSVQETKHLKKTMCFKKISF